MDQLKDWFGEETLRTREDRLRRFWAGEGRVMYSCQTNQFDYRQVMDPDVMLDRVGPNLEAQSVLPGENLPSFFPDFGAVWPAPYWGERVVLPTTDGARIHIETAAQTLDQALAIERRPVDDPDMAAARGLALYHAACRRLGTDQLWYRMTGHQGPLNTAALVVKQDELFVGMYTEPDKVHAFLSGVTDFLIDYFEYQKRECGGRMAGDIWPYHWFPPEVGVSFTEDLMPLLSAEVYATFGLPYVRRIAENAGGTFIHCCGDFGRHAPALASLGSLLRGVEFHYPFTRIEELQDHLPAHTVYVPMIALDRQHEFASQRAYLDHLLTHAAPHTRWWIILDEGQPEREEFIRLIERHQDACATRPCCRH